MNQNPRLMALMNDKYKYVHYDDVNALLQTLEDEKTVEPIDDPTCHPMDWAEVIGIADEVFDEIYPDEPFWAEIN